jgi:hypothetical protein
MSVLYGTDSGQGQRFTVEQLLHDNAIYLDSHEPGEHYSTCPRCSHQRKHKANKCLSIKIDGRGTCWKCHQCGWTGPEKGNGRDRELPAHVYCDPATGEPRFRKVRNVPGREPRFWLERADGKGEWTKGVKGVDTSILYRADEVKEQISLGRTIAVCEGESDCDALWAIGIPATTSAHGAAATRDADGNPIQYKPKWYRAHSEQLRGADIVVLNDNDEPGYKHADTVCALSAGIAKTVHRLDLKLHWPEIPEGGDVRAWLNGGGGTREQLDALMAAALDYEPSSDDGPSGDEVVFTPQPYVSTDPKLLPLRDWLYRPYLIRKFVSVDIAPGGLAKSAHSLVEACAMASGRNLLGVTPAGRLRVWYWNLEDPADEIDKRIAAIRIHYDLKPEDLDGYLFVNHGRETPLIIGTADRNGPRIFKPVVDGLIAAIQRTSIDVIMVDPFVSTHRVNENDNVAVDMVAKEWGNVADAGNCAARLTHHTRKGELEVTAESSRGASAMSYAGRVVRTLNRMTREEADQIGIDGEHRRRYYRTYIDKQNMAPPADTSDWFYLESVDLDNDPIRNVNPLTRGDSVGVVTPWQWPTDIARVTDDDLKACLEAIKKSSRRWRKDPKANDWVGDLVAKVIGLDLDRKAHRSRVNAILKKWIAEGALRVVPDKDDQRKVREYVEAAGK